MDDTHTLHVRDQAILRKEGDAPNPEVPVNHVRLFDERGKPLLDPADIPSQDMLAWVAQGPISDRTFEHLVTSDRGVATYHNLLLEQIEVAERGEDPMAVIRDREENEPFIALPREKRGYRAFFTIDGVYKEPERQETRGPVRV
jgi:5,5'-dehydrodivanillate O-demethylase